MNPVASVFDVNGPVDTLPVRRKYALGATIEQLSFPGSEVETDLDLFIDRHEAAVRQHLQDLIIRHRYYCIVVLNI